MTHPIQQAHQSSFFHKADQSIFAIELPPFLNHSTTIPFIDSDGVY